LAFDAVGTPYDVVEVTAGTTLDLATASGAGKYSGIVSIQQNLLDGSQQSQIINYQKQVFILFYISICSNNLCSIALNGQ
jgi:hypothetical protein